MKKRILSVLVSMILICNIFFPAALESGVSEAENAINSLPSIITEDNIDTVEEAQDKYDMLFQEQKAMVSNYSKLQKAIEAAEDICSDISPEKYYSEQTSFTSTALFQIKADNNAAGQFFIPGFYRIGAIKIYTSSEAGTKYTLRICTDPNNEKTDIYTETFTKTQSGADWLLLELSCAVEVEKGEQYAFVVSTDNSAILFGDANIDNALCSACNYDFNAYKGWIYPKMRTAFKIIGKHYRPNEIIEKIEALPEDITKNDIEAVNNVYELYNSLLEIGKADVTNYSKLEKAIEKVRALNSDIMKTQAADLDSEISELSNITLSKIKDIVRLENRYKELYELYGEDLIPYVKNLATLTAARETYEKLRTVIYGDINNDGSISASDALIALQCAVKRVELDYFKSVAANVDGSEQISANDALLILQYSVGKINKFNIENEEINKLLTEKNSTLFNNTYKSMIERTEPSGYANTSITGAYNGMFSRDTSIQIMAHIKKGDYEIARQLLKYVLSYQVASGYNYALHILNNYTNDFNGNAYDGYNDGTTPATGRYNLGAGASVSQVIGAESQQLVSVGVILSKTTQAKGKVKAKLIRNSDGYTISETSINVEDIVNNEQTLFRFTLPLILGNSSKGYTITLSAPESAENSILVHLAGSGNGMCYMADGESGFSSVSNNEIAYYAYTTKVVPYSKMIQPDANYMLIHAWAMFYNNADKTDLETASFLSDSYGIIKKLADYYSGDDYIHGNGLMENPNFEHSRGGRYWDSYDLITNVFASQAFYELSIIADKKEDSTSSKYYSLAKKLESGINENLITKIDNTDVYAELIAIDTGNLYIKGFSWVNWAPVAAEWFGLKSDVMNNTYEKYKDYGSVIYYNKYRMLEVASDFTNKPLTQANGNHVIGKGFAWELMYCKKTNDFERLLELLSFIEENSPNEMYMETWLFSGGGSDTANQEHGSWMLYAMQTLFGNTD